MLCTELTWQHSTVRHVVFHPCRTFPFNYFCFQGLIPTLSSTGKTDPGTDEGGDDGGDDTDGGKFAVT